MVAVGSGSCPLSGPDVTIKELIMKRMALLVGVVALTTVVI